MKVRVFDSGIGYITIKEEDNAVVEISFGKNADDKMEPSALLDQAEREIIEYLSKKRKAFDFNYRISGSKFEQDILKTMKEIPYGKTLSYQKLAEKAGYRRAARAAGTVCRKNKLPLLFPCHRVIRSDGEIGQYAGGDNVKIHLLEMEKRL